MRRLKLSIIFALIGGSAALYLLPSRTTSVKGRILDAPLGSPTNVSASDGNYAQKIEVSWETVRDATLYRVFRNDTENYITAVDVGTTEANYFFDTPPAAATPYYYWVRAENGGNVSQLSRGDGGFRAVVTGDPNDFFPLEPPPAPPENPITAAKAYLGKALFWDEQLSSTNTVSCGTCHRPGAGGSDPRTIFNDDRARNPGFDNVFNTADDVFGSPGVIDNNANGLYNWNSLFKFREQVTGRKSPTYLNAGYTRNGLFWDGRAGDVFHDQITNDVLLTAYGGLENQAAGPPVNAGEMGHNGRSWVDVAARIQNVRPLALATHIPPALKNWISGRSYPELFREAFGTPQVTPARIAMAIGTHERTLFSDRTPLDEYAQGISELHPDEDGGRIVFLTNSCIACHGGPLLSDGNYHNIGVRPQFEDRGRGAITGLQDDDGRFRTPSLRNVFLRSPYFHNGKKEAIEGVVEFYRIGGEFNAPNIDRDLIHPLSLTNEQRANLAAFLKRPLTDPRVRDETAPFDRPRLYTESERVPLIHGTGRAGSGARVPDATAIEPPMLGNPNFTLGVSNGLGGAAAKLVIDSADPGVGASVPTIGSFGVYTITLAGTGSGNGYGSIALAIPSDPAFVGRTFYGRWYVTDAGAENGFAVSRLIQFTIFSPVQPGTAFDFDGDGKTDIGIYRPNGVNGSEWWISKSSNDGVFATQFGAATDSVVAADYTGDGKADVAFWRPSTGYWYVLRSEDMTYYATPFGANGDVPVPADYDADGKADTAVFRPSNSTWYINNTTGGTTITGFGAAGDKPVAADYDGDGKADIAVFRPNGANGAEWWILKSSDNSVFATQFGSSTDKAVPADYTGDGKADIAFWTSGGTWYILRSEDLTYYADQFGTTGDVPSPGDYDGDGQADAAVFRPTGSTWYVKRSTAGLLIKQFGSTGDIPVPSIFVR